MVTAKTYQDLRPMLMEQSVKGIKTPYYLITDQGGVLFVVSPGCNGVEFNKTSGYLSNYPGMQTYSCVHGSGILLMQRNDELGVAKEFKLATLSPLKQITVPAGWAMCLVNTGNSYLVILRNSVLDEKYITSKQLAEKAGLAYYVIEKRGEIAIEPNPNYSIHPQIIME